MPVRTAIAMDAPALLSRTKLAPLTAASVTTFRSTARAAAAGRPRPGNEPGSAPSPAQRRRSLGRVRSAANFPPPYHTIPPSFAVCPDRPTAYPATPPRPPVPYPFPAPPPPPPPPVNHPPPP